MDSFEVNKIAGAVLSALLVIFSIRTLYDIVRQEHKPEKPGWALPVTEVSSAKPAAPEAPFDVAKVLQLLPKANADNGADTFKKCMACHTGTKDGRNLVGPNLWGIVDRPVGQHAGFPYSEAMKKHGGKWGWKELATYLHDPKATVPGNKMAFPGVKDPQDLADLLAYLRKLADSPAPLPQ
ncbi:MAG TPA: cytochrome c family protein [Hyphomicrobiaceae bacterium]|jgi:cytochrome c|nr:cytochrome c family protein [Hyphomicrobiaceae bacterium]